MKNVVSIKSLICPVYNLFLNESNSCDQIPSLCTYIRTSSTHRRCLGIYKLERNFVRIRQLALVDDYEEKYFNASECLLQIDRTGQNLLCRCNSNNCTLDWRIEREFLQGIEQNSNSWFVPLLITFVILLVVIILLMIFIHCWNRRRRRDEKTKGLFFGNCPSMSTNISNTEIDEFLSSTGHSQSIVSHGKTSVIYRTWTTGKESCSNEKKLVAVKLYHQQDLFENELHILRTIEHSTIIK